MREKITGNFISTEPVCAKGIIYILTKSEKFIFFKLLNSVELGLRGACAISPKKGIGNRGRASHTESGKRMFEETCIFSPGQKSGKHIFIFFKGRENSFRCKMVNLNQEPVTEILPYAKTSSIPKIGNTNYCSKDMLFSVIQNSFFRRIFSCFNKLSDIASNGKVLPRVRNPQFRVIPKASFLCWNAMNSQKVIPILRLLSEGGEKNEDFKKGYHTDFQGLGRRSPNYR